MLTGLLFDTSVEFTAMSGIGTDLPTFVLQRFIQNRGRHVLFEVARLAELPPFNHLFRPSFR